MSWSRRKCQSAALVSSFCVSFHILSAKSSSSKHLCVCTDCQPALTSIGHFTPLAPFFPAPAKSLSVFAAAHLVTGVISAPFCRPPSDYNTCVTCKMLVSHTSLHEKFVRSLRLNCRQLSGHYQLSALQPFLLVRAALRVF